MKTNKIQSSYEHSTREHTILRVKKPASYHIHTHIKLDSSDPERFSQTEKSAVIYYYCDDINHLSEDISRIISKEILHGNMGQLQKIEVKVEL